MAGLVLKLRPYEKFLINGTVLQNGPRQGQVTVENPDASVLRLSDAIHPSEATTPVKQLYYLIQLVISQDIEYAQAEDAIEESIIALKLVFEGTQCEAILHRVKVTIGRGLYYSALLSLKKVVAFEQKIVLANSSASIADALPTEAA